MITVINDYPKSKGTDHDESLRLLPLLDLRQCLFDGAMRFVFEFRVSNQPLIECFFRPEEVDDPSTTAQKENSRSRFLRYYLALIKDEANTGRALRRGIVNRHFFICEFAADQQH